MSDLMGERPRVGVARPDPECEFCHGAGWLYVPSEASPTGIRAVQCRCLQREVRRVGVQRIMAESGLLPSELERWTFASFNPEDADTDAAGKRLLAAAKDDLMAYAMNPQGWRVLMGVYGCGKTHLAYATAAHRARLGRPVYVSTVPDLLDMLRRGFDSPDYGYERRMDTLRDVELLVLDDLGTENATPFALEKLYQIIDYRYRGRLPLIVTTNRNLARDDTGIPQRIVSRLLDTDLSRVWAFRAGDYRRRGR